MPTSPGTRSRKSVSAPVSDPVSAGATNAPRGANTNTRANAPAQYNSKWFDSLSETPNIGKGQTVSDVQLAVALRKTYGNRSRAAALLGVVPETVYNRVRNSPVLQRIMQEAAEQTIDLAEDVNLQAVRNGDEATAKWLLLNTRTGRERGYGEKRDLTLTPTDVAALAAAFRGDSEALGRLNTALDTSLAEEQGDAEADDSERAPRRAGKGSDGRGRKGVRAPKG